MFLAWFSQRRLFFSVNVIDDYILNEDGIPSKQYSIEFDSELIDEGFEPADIPDQMITSGAFTFPD